MKVFIDAAAWIALVNSRDNLNARALQIYRDLQLQKTQFVTTEFVLIELADALCNPFQRARTIAFIDGLREIEELKILPVSEELLQAGWQLYSQRADKDWGLTDCISFAAMTRENLSRAFTSDAHFAQAGFEKLL